MAHAGTDPRDHFVRPRAADVPHDSWSRLARLERLADNLDSRYRIPGTSIRFGWDSIIGLIPGIGDIAPLGPAGYIFLEGHRMGVPGPTKARMAANIGIDWVIGSIPLLGDLLDVGFKANRRNVALIRAHLEREHPRREDRAAEVAAPPVQPKPAAEPSPAGVPPRPHAALDTTPGAPNPGVVRHDLR